MQNEISSYPAAPENELELLGVALNSMGQDSPADGLHDQLLKIKDLSRQGIQDPRLTEYLDELWDMAFTTLVENRLAAAIIRLVILKGAQE